MYTLYMYSEIGEQWDPSLAHAPFFYVSPPLFIEIDMINVIYYFPLCNKYYYIILLLYYYILSSFVFLVRQ